MNHRRNLILVLIASSILAVSLLLAVGMNTPVPPLGCGNRYPEPIPDRECLTGNPGG